MIPIIIGAAAVNTTPLAWENNVRAVTGAIIEAARHKVDILCLPEMCLTGYGCEDEFHAPFVRHTAQRMLREVQRRVEHNVPTYCVGLPILYQNALFNAVAVIHRDNLIGVVPKQHLAGDGLHYEHRWFHEWPRGLRTTINLGTAEREGKDVPFGDLIFDIDGIRIGFEICEDAWVADRPGAILARKGVDIILNPSASHFAFGKHAIRERFVIEGSRAFSTTYVYANLLGCEAGRAIYDGDTMIATGGRLVSRGSRFSYAPHTLATAVVDVEATRISQSRTASYAPSFDDEGVVRVGHNTFLDKMRERPYVESLPPDAPTWEGASPDTLRMNEFSRAVALGLWDYMRKSGTSGFVISLSGGADSAACAALVRLMVRYGCDELGVDGFRRSIGLRPSQLLPEGGTAEGAIMHQILTCVYQASENSSKTTQSAAEDVAKGLGAEYHVLDLSKVIASYTEMVAKAMGRDLTWENADTTLQNIQARVRAPSIWMFANLKNALLLATSNRSEASVGYCTMDGDTAGSHAPLGGIDKPFIRAWLAHLAAYDHQFQCLGAVVSQQPTAELRPAAQVQTDEKDLMPYTVLNAAEKGLVRDKKSPVDVYRTLRTLFPQHTREDLKLWVERYIKLWCRNQWKRERYAPSFHVDDENVDPKTWCRFPILSGGFREELSELQRYYEGGG